ncbi:hypothetical protein [Methylorubrum zatmanii]|uniref:Uncharacterized protein n=1 Tax=Methylorubrum zatmanii TaxID=29429 RepID=A0ABW1WND8_9HYPH|nr:hypothetical protein [Methylorubrum zatmanii]MBD8906987.1 hypothetical protein [Methylorubrum zatmanii]
MIALAVLAVAIANVTLVVLLADRFGTEGVHASAGELTSLQASGRPAAPAAAFSLANENTVAAATRIAA